MSGYFARLAAQVRGPVAVAPRTAVIAPLEQHVEVEAPVTTSGRHDAGAVLPALAPVQMAAVPMPSASAAMPMDVRSTQTSAASSMDHDATSMHLSPAPTAARTTAPITTPSAMLPSAPTPRSAPDSLAPARVLPLRDTVLPASSTLTADTPMSKPSSGDAFMAAAPFEPHSDTAPAGARFIDVQHHVAVRETQALRASAIPVAERPRVVAPLAAVAALDVPSNRETPAARTEVRIGTIALQVHTPPPVVPRPVPQPIAAPTPAPPRFSLQRHYLRWG